jgi:hypothetical protein
LLLPVRDPEGREVSRWPWQCWKRRLAEAKSKAWQAADRQQINNVQSGIWQW